MNVVCLVGRLSRRASARPLPEGWSHRVLEVQRQALEGGHDAGVFEVSLMLPPGLSSDAHDDARADDGVTVVGRLDVDVHYSHKPPLAHYAVVVQRIEPVPRRVHPTVPGSGSAAARSTSYF